MNNKNIGTPSDLIMKRSVLKHLKKRTKFMTAGPTSGSDFTVYRNMITANGAADSVFLKDIEDISAAGLAFTRAKNHLSLAFPLTENEKIDGCTMIIDMILGGDCKEEVIRKEMNLLTELAAKEGITIIGGNTRYLGNGDDYSVNIILNRMIEKDDISNVIWNKKIQPGDKLIMAGTTGMLGATLLKMNYKEELVKRFSKSYIDTMGYPFEMNDISAMAGIAIEYAVKMHDISNGGVYAAIYQLTDAADLGINIIHENIPMEQPTVEIAEFFGINPYKMLGTGALLVAVRDKEAKEILDKFQKLGYTASVIGEFTKGKDRVIGSLKYKMRRVITPYDHDELATLISYEKLKEGQEC